MLRPLNTGYYDLTCMPVIRYPNFSDKTGDISPDKFYLLVGNEKGIDRSSKNSSDEEKGLNMVLLIQVPLKQKRKIRYSFYDTGGYLCCKELEKCAKSDVENAVMKGQLNRAFTEAGGS